MQTFQSAAGESLIDFIDRCERVVFYLKDDFAANDSFFGADDVETLEQLAKLARKIRDKQNKHKIESLDE